MNTFILNIVENLIQRNLNFNQTTVVLPGKRPILFFKNYFKEQEYFKSGMLPKFLSIEEFLQQVSGFIPMDNIELCLTSYQIYQAQTKNPEPLFDFLRWINTLLNDFNDIDKMLVPENELFQYLISVERISKWGVENNSSESWVKDQITFWEQSALLYRSLNENLSKHKSSYNGMLFKTATKNLDNYLKENNEFFIFAGFNALTTAEEQIIQKLENKGRAITYWQADRYYLENPNHEAGHFLRKHNKTRKQFNWITDDFVQPKKMKVIEVSQQVGQAKYVSKILSQLSKTEIENTALVLANEGLLFSVLNSLPKNVLHVNITMGLPLQQVPMSSFFLQLFDLHLNRERIGEGLKYYYSDVISILEQRYFTLNNKSQKLNKQLISEINKKNKIFTLESFFNKSSFSELFKIHDSPPDFITAVLNFISNIIHNQSDLTQEILANFHRIFTNLKSTTQKYEKEIDFKTLKLLLLNSIQNEKISFIGEPLQGLQITGMLETRLLDFERVIICNVNEDILPLGSNENSFIPYDIRKQFKLNTYTENDAIYAYHFYRLIQKPKEVYLLYNSDTEGLNNGEKSRFIRQLEHESNHKIEHIQVISEFKSKAKEIIQIPKSNLVMDRLNRWSQRGISASALNSYIRNPIQFYQQRILGIRQLDELEESVGSLTLGNIVHKTLEDLYKPLINKVLIQKDLDKIKKESNQMVQDLFRSELGSSSFKSGRNLIALNVAKTMVKELINKDIHDVKSNEIIVKNLELPLSIDYNTKNHSNLKLFGIIDRLDEFNGMERIIDYKTGTVHENALNVNIKKQDSYATDPKKSIAFQLMFYAQLYFKTSGREVANFGIYPLRYTKKSLLSLKIDGDETINKNQVAWFQEPLNQLIDEILNPDIDFTEKLEN